MTIGVYECVTRDGKEVKVSTLAEAKAIKEDGGRYTLKYKYLGDMDNAVYKDGMLINK